MQVIVSSAVLKSSVMRGSRLSGARKPLVGAGHLDSRMRLLPAVASVETMKMAVSAA